MTIWFTADTHFGHANIIKPTFCNRPYDNIEEMNEGLISNWNKLVSPKDDVYHLGDFSFERKPQNTARRLNGNKHLIKGNHDKRHHLKLLAPHFNWIKDVYGLKALNERFWLSHFAHRAWRHNYKGVIHLYGHSHGELEDYGKSTDVGVDAWNYEPVNIEVIIKIMAKRENIPHHKRTR